MDAGRPAAGDHVGGDRRDRAGDRRRRRPADLLDGEVVGQGRRLSGEQALDPDVLDVGAALVGPIPRLPMYAAANRRGEIGTPSTSNGRLAIEAQLEQDPDAPRLVGRVADLEHDVRDVDGARQGDRLGVGDEVDLLLAVRLREGEALLAAERRRARRARRPRGRATFPCSHRSGSPRCPATSTSGG